MTTKDDYANGMVYGRKAAATDMMDAMAEDVAVHAAERCNHTDAIRAAMLCISIRNDEAVDFKVHSNLKDEIENEREALARDAERLSELIGEGLRDDAISLLGEMMDQKFRSVREQRNLFPDRIPA